MNFSYAFLPIKSKREKPIVKNEIAIKIFKERGNSLNEFTKIINEGRDKRKT